MNNIVPQIIANHSARRERQGQLKGCALYINIEGFDRIAEFLIPQGTSGQSRLKGYIQQLYPALVDSVYRREGFIFHLTSGKIMAFFPENAVDKALYSAIELRRLFQQIEVEEEGLHKPQIIARIGLSFGKIDWTILEDDHNQNWFFQGEAITSAAEAEYWCRKNEIICAEAVKEQVDPKQFILRDVEKYFYKMAVSNWEEEEPDEVTLPEIPDEIIQTFFPPSVLSLFPEGLVKGLTLLAVELRGTAEESIIHKRIHETNQLLHTMGGLCQGWDYSQKDPHALYVFGLGSNQDHRRDALEGALLLQKKLGAHAKTAIHHGPLFAALLGNQKRAGFSLLGDTRYLLDQLLEKITWEEAAFFSSLTEAAQGFQWSEKGQFQFKRRGNPLSVYLLKDHADPVAETPESQGLTDAIEHLKQLFTAGEEEAFLLETQILQEKLKEEELRPASADEETLFQETLTGLLTELFNKPPRT